MSRDFPAPSAETTSFRPGGTSIGAAASEASEGAGFPTVVRDSDDVPERLASVLERVLLKADLKALDREAYQRVMADLKARAAEWEAKA